MILNRIFGIVPAKYKSYDYLSRFIPVKIRREVDKVVHQFRNNGSIRTESSTLSETEQMDQQQVDVEKKRENLVRNMLNDENGQFPRGYTDRAHEQSLKDHQAEESFSGSPVNGAGNTGGKVNSNMSQRNYTH